ncbi:MAG: thrombospondin type 3 repeat-containing protein, partial [Myxococcota bacterium]
MKHSRLWMMLIGAGLMTAIVVPGCTIGSKLRAKYTEVADTNARIERRAYRCAPKEFALAKAHAEFGLYELQKGDWPRADDHLALAYENANLADVNSDRPECREVATLDRDGDGIPDNVDVCPDEPEDIDGYEDSDGCPEDQDTDGDGLVDSRDMCPTEPGPKENQGCPNVVADKDKDGIMDNVDKCPLDPEDFDGFEDVDGCPDLDNDQDGIADLNDKCPDNPEDKDKFEDEDGCPDADNDQDTICDPWVNQTGQGDKFGCIALDECPDEKGLEEFKGCPGPKRVVVTAERIEISEMVNFRPLKTEILPESFSLLDEVTDIVLKFPRLKKIEIQGHTDMTRNHRFGTALAELVAEAMVSGDVGVALDLDL